MPATLSPRRWFRPGILFHGHSLWLSELLAITMVSLLLLALFSISGVVLANALAIRANDRLIAADRAERIVIEHETVLLRSEARIVSLLRRLAGGNIPDHALCRLGSLISRNSAQFGYDPLLLLAVLRQESVFDPKATGRFRSGKESGALGLMQIKIETATEVAKRLEMPPPTEKELLKPEINLVIGVAYLTSLISRFRSFRLGLLAYNLGPGMVRETLASRDTLPSEYYRKVLRRYERLKKLSANIEKQGNCAE